MGKVTRENMDGQMDFEEEYSETKLKHFTQFFFLSLR